MGLFGGGNSSSTNTSNNYDQRQIVNNTTDNYDLSNRSTNDYSDRSTNSYDLSNNSTNSYDLSNRSSNAYDLSNRSTTNNSTTTNADLSDHSYSTVWADSSNRSSVWSDSSNRSNTTINTTTTDGGAVAGALSLASGAVQQVGSQLANLLGFATTVSDNQNKTLLSGYDFADHLFNGVMDTVESNQAATMDAFTKAAAIQSSAFNQLGSAYADAKGTTAAQQKIMLAVLAVAALAMFARK